MSGPHNGREQLPEALLAAWRADSASVRPLAPPSRRALLLALPALGALAVAATILARAESHGRLWSLSGGGVSLLQWAAGLALLWLALREAVPGLGIGAARLLAALLGGVALQFGLGLAVFLEAHSGLTAPGAWAEGAHCASIVGALGLPHLALAIWLALRALPIRPRGSGALAGAAAGLIADSLWHLACVRSDLEHLLLWHGGATVALALLGALTGLFWPHAARRRR